MKTKIFLSLGWGVQSFTIAAMSALGELPKCVAIHADTAWEHQHTYKFSDHWAEWLIKNGVDYHVVSDESNQHIITKSTTHAPLFTSDGGMLRRSCTDRWKIRPVRRLIKSILTKGQTCEQWLGISLDEVQQSRIPLLSLNQSDGQTYNQGSFFDDSDICDSGYCFL